MKPSFHTNIKPHVLSELSKARKEKDAGHYAQSFEHLEVAHILGQSSTRLHVRAHVEMLLWAVRVRDTREVIAQAIRILGAATKTWVGLVPSGNSGGGNVSAFASKPLSPDHAELINRARAR